MVSFHKSWVSEEFSFVCIRNYNILLQGNLNIAPMQDMTYKNNITHSFDVTSNVCYKTLIPWLSMLYYIYDT